MGSTGEPDRKRRLSSSFAPGATAVAPAKRPALPPCSDNKKLDFAVLKYRNQKLSEQLEVHKFEYRALEGKFDDLKQRQKAHNETLDLVNKSWEHLVRDLEITSVCKSRSQNSAYSTGHSNLSMDGACISQDKDILSRLVETGATENSDVLECKDREYYEWVRVQSLKSSLDESRLEQRVKAANEAEAMSQQRLASAEAEIAELRHTMEISRRDIGCLSELLKSKHEEGEAYLSEIESIAQAYEDIQTQNQQLLQQIIER